MCSLANIPTRWSPATSITCTSQHISLNKWELSQRKLAKCLYLGKTVRIWRVVCKFQLVSFAISIKDILQRRGGSFKRPYSAMLRDAGDYEDSKQKALNLFMRSSLWKWKHYHAKVHHNILYILQLIVHFVCTRCHLPDHSSQIEKTNLHDHKFSHACLLLGGKSIPQYILQDNHSCWQNSEITSSSSVPALTSNCRETWDDSLPYL